MHVDRLVDEVKRLEKQLTGRQSLYALFNMRQELTKAAPVLADEIIRLKRGIREISMMRDLEVIVDRLKALAK